LEGLLSASSAALTDGLSDSEFAQIEDRFGFSFGPDHRELLATRFPSAMEGSTGGAVQGPTFNHALIGRLTA
jgi:hypothetical protein